jgi:simple sugar transport system substrate-binding protein
VKSVVEAAGLDFEIVELSQDPSKITEVMVNFLRANTDAVAAIATFTPAVPGFAAAIEELDADVLLAVFDLNGEVIARIQDGSVSWTIDQQPWWRGYVPVWDLAMNTMYGLQRANWFLTGPAVIDASNIEATVAGVEGGYR